MSITDFNWNVKIKAEKLKNNRVIFEIKTFAMIKIM